MTQITLAEPVDFTIPRGNAWSLIMEPFEDDAETVRSDLADFVVIMVGRRHKGHPAELFRWSTLTEELIVAAAEEAPVGDWLLLTLTADQTSLVTGGGAYEIAKHPADDPSALVEVTSGLFGVEQTVATP